MVTAGCDMIWPKAKRNRVGLVREGCGGDTGGGFLFQAFTNRKQDGFGQVPRKQAGPGLAAMPGTRSPRLFGGTKSEI